MVDFLVKNIDLRYNMIMNFWKKKKTIVTHNGSFHADDIFACAVLGLYLDIQNQKYIIIRTRDENQINTNNLDKIVVDVGGVYDQDSNKFDHHQIGGAGSRSNSVPYASFGLVWKKYGPLLCSDSDIVQDIDRRLVQPIDAIDNGMSITEPSECGIYEYGIYGIVTAYQNTWKEAGDTKKQYNSFVYLVEFFKEIIIREIERCKHNIEIISCIEDCYQSSENKNIIQVPHHVTMGSLLQVLDKYKQVLFVVCRSNTNWKVIAIRKEPCSFENRKSLPALWAGKRGKELQKITGIPDAVFCHNALFMAVAVSKEGALRLAKIALETND